MTMSHTLSVLIPAHNEGPWIANCLDALFRSEGKLPAREVIVIANACTDDTAARVRDLVNKAEAHGWRLSVIETDTPGKLNALDLGDAAATGQSRIYLDADVRVSRDVIAALAAVLDTDLPRYATGTPRVAQAETGTSRAYARFWTQLPFVARGTPGFGLFGLNIAGRARWETWPDIISDDMFARLNFAPSERVRVAQSYEWPLVEGLGNLIRVRRRQDAGVAELAQSYPALMKNEDKGMLDRSELLHLAMRDPVGFGVYALVALGVRSPLFSGGHRWARGR